MRPSMRHHIVFLDRSTLRARIRQPSFDHTWEDHEVTRSEDEVRTRLQNATIAITNKVPLRSRVLEGLPRLGLIAMAATGYDVIDVGFCKANRIAICNIRGYATHTVPEHAFAMILALRRNLLAYRDDVRSGRWQRTEQFCFFDHPIRDLADSTLGIIGEGALGQAVACIGRAFGMRVLFADHGPPKAPGVVFTPLETVLRLSDVVSIHAPLTPDTRNLIGANELGLMKPTAILVNTARGGIVDETALASALKEGTIGGAGFDVLTHEPPRDDHPLLALQGANFILTPHVAWASDGAMQALADQLIDNIEAFASGEPRNLIY